MNIKQFRENLRLSRAEFADKIGYSVKTIIAWENGHREPSERAKRLIRQLHPNDETIAELIFKHAVNSSIHGIKVKSPNKFKYEDGVFTFQDGSQIILTEKGLIIKKEDKS